MLFHHQSFHCQRKRQEAGGGGTRWGERRSRKEDPTMLGRAQCAWRYQGLEGSAHVQYEEYKEFNNRTRERKRALYLCVHANE